MAFGLMGKTLNLYTDRIWDVQNKKGKLVASDEVSRTTNVTKVGDGLELTLMEENGKRWLRMTESTGVLPWMGTKSSMEALEGI